MFNVAVVTPVYNTQDYLHKCIKSVLQQRGVSLQHFIIDDGSTDNSAKIAEYYQKQDSRVTFIKKSNEGQGTARNVGIKLANAEYIYFVDSDDSLGGENTLSTLYQVAKEKNLDICSPDVPKHYFNKPLEYVPCLPCKSQFIRMDLIRDFEILQPAIRSGQDGVFSHLVLTHCTRIGMASNAKFYYTHAREGSTFATYLKRHDLVPKLLEQHYEAIVEHYDKYNLWYKNALRLLWFMSDESLRNRLEPHLPHLNDAQKRQAFQVLSEIAKKAYGYISEDYKSHINPAVVALATKNIDFLVKNYERDFAGRTFKTDFSKDHNIYKKDVVVCKFANKELEPDPKLKQENSMQEVPKIEQDSSHDLNFVKDDLRSLRGKLDFAINSINNSTIQLASAIRNPAPDSSKGKNEIVASITTLPHRLPLVHYSIESMFAQTIVPGKIVLWITNKINQEQFMTPELHSLVERGLEIRSVEDVGPQTKLLYALKEFPDKSIITFDDDIVYPTNTVQYLWDQHLHFPNAVICNWARELAFDSSGKVKGVRAGKLLTPPTLETEIEQKERYYGKPNLLAVPYGTSGVLYPPNALSSKVFDVDTFKKLCPKEDDIWFKAMSLLNKTPVVVTNLGINPVHYCIMGSQIDALRHENHGKQLNVDQMRPVFEKLDLYKCLKEEGLLVS